MVQDYDQLYREAVTAIRAGDKGSARAKLERVVEADPAHEQAWLWLSAAVDTNEERITCLQNALTINPNNEAARKGLAKLGGSLDIDTNAAGAPTAPPINIPEPAPPRPMEHGAAPAVESLFSKANKAAAQDAAPPPPKKSTQPDESWRKQLYDNVPPPPASNKHEAARAKFLRDDEPRPDRNLLDLMDAWVAAIMFNADGAYGQEIRVASLGRWFFGIVIAAVLTSLTQAFSVLVQLTVGGMTIESVQREFWQPMVEQGRLTAETIQIMPGGTVLFLIVATSFFGTIIGLSIYHTLTHVAAGFLGGKGSLVETLHMLSIAEVAARMVALVPIVLGSLLPGVGVILNFVMFLYSVALSVVALTYAHSEFWIGKSILSLLFGSLLIVVFGCCLVIALVFAAAPGAS